MKSLQHWFLALAAVAATTNLVGQGKQESHLGEYGPAFPVAPLTGEQKEAHMGEYGPAFPVAPLMGQERPVGQMGESGPPQLQTPAP